MIVARDRKFKGYVVLLTKMNMSTEKRHNETHSNLRKMKFSLGYSMVTRWLLVVTRSNWHYYI